MNDHVFLTIFLPVLLFDAPPELSYEELRFFLHLNLSSREKKVLYDLLSFYDLENVRAWILQKPMSARGSRTHEELKDRLTEGNTGIAVVDTFLKEYPTPEERVRNLPLLSKLYIKAATK